MSSLSKPKEESNESGPTASSSASILPNNNTVHPQPKPGELTTKGEDCSIASPEIVIDNVHMPCLDPVSPFTRVPIMKPDIVFFGEVSRHFIFKCRLT